jgi:hypothetical protein
MMPWYTNVAAMAGGGSAPPASGATWDPANKNSNVTLSANKLTATASSAATLDSAGIATIAIATGQSIYAEVVCNSKSGTAEPGVGLANASFTFGAGNYLGIDTNSLCLFQSNSVWYNNAHVFTADSFGAGDTIRVSVKKLDADTLHVWFATNSEDWNGDPTADPATDTGGFTVSISGDVYIAYNVDFASSTATQFTLVQPGSFTNDAPSGFTEYGAAS